MIGLSEAALRILWSNLPNPKMNTTNKSQGGSYWSLLCVVSFLAEGLYYIPFIFLFPQSS